jgi:putative membrane protein
VYDTSTIGLWCIIAPKFSNIPFYYKEKTMNIILNIIIGIVALLHGYFLILEMFLWDKPAGRKSFRTTAEFAAQSKTLAANQGLYNGFLSAGLIWGIFAGDAVKIFFLSCVIIAGIFGAYTVSKIIFYIQALPALIGLVLLVVT